MRSMRVISREARVPGSAIAVALNLVSFALGTDTAGSGRVPAGFGNIVGLKPTRGAISTAGVVPACRTLDCVSIFALTAGDAWDVYQVARGYDAADAYSRHPQPSLHMPAAPLRCGVPRASQLDFCGDAEAAKMFERGVALIEQAGGRIVEIDFAPFRETAALLYQGPWVAERLAGIKDFFAAHQQEMYPVTRDITAGGARYSAVDAFEAAYRLQELKRRAAAELNQIDVMLVPTAPTIYTLEQIAADPVRLNSNLGLYTNFVNLLDLAAIAVPAGMRSDGLPSGITLIAPAFSEPLLCELGDRLHRLAGVKLGATAYELPPPRANFAIRGQCPRNRRGGRRASFRHAAQSSAHAARRAADRRHAHRAALPALSAARHHPPKPGLVRCATHPAMRSKSSYGACRSNATASSWRKFPRRWVSARSPRGRAQRAGVCLRSDAIAQARDISEFGGWRRFISEQKN